MGRTTQSRWSPIDGGWIGHLLSLFFFIVVKFTQHKIHNFNVLKRAINWHLVQPHCCAATTSVSFRNTSITPKGSLYP